MKTAVIYARYSSDSQSEQSIDGQLRVCEEYAKNNDLLIVATYIDRAMTGTNDNRPDFQRMIKDSSSKSWDYVLVYKFDRFSRNKFEAGLHKRTLKNNGVKVISATEYIPDSPEAIILESMLEGYAEYFSAELAQKVKRGMRETRRKGNFQGGTLLYGYKLDGRKIVIDEEKAEIVNYIYEQYSKGVYVRNIIKALTSQGVIYRGKPFATNTIYNILKNKKYSGVYYYENERIDNMYPQIVPTDLFEKVRAIIDKNKSGKRSIRVDYLLRHKLKCGYCGEPISAECGTARNGEVVRYYKCLGRKKHKNDCQKSMVKKEELETFVIQSILEELSKPDTMRKIVNGLLKTQDYQLKLNSSLNNLLRAKSNTEKALENIMTAIENGIISQTTNKRLHELETKIEDLERDILIQRSKITVKYTEKDIESYYTKMLELDPEMLINYAVKEITLYDDKIKIKLNNPIKNSPDDNQGLSFTQKSKKLYKVEIQLEICV